MKIAALIILLTLSQFSTAAVDSKLQKAEKLLASDLAALSNLKFENVSPAHLRYFNSSDGASLVRLFKSKFPNTALDSRPDVGASASNGLIAIGPMYAPADQVARWGMLMHELQHRLRTDLTHATCPVDQKFEFDGVRYPLKNNPVAGLAQACDPGADGAYSAGFVFLDSIMETCTNCSAEMKQQALNSALPLLVRLLGPNTATQLVKEASVNFNWWSQNMPTMIEQLNKAFLDAKKHDGASSVPTPNSPVRDKKVCTYQPTGNNFGLIYGSTDFTTAETYQLNYGALVRIVDNVKINAGDGTLRNGVKFEIVSNPSASSFDAEPSVIYFEFLSLLNGDCH